jgi:hypothetical protein
VTSDWNASTATWTLQPSVDKSDVMSATSDAGEWTSIDVSAYMTDVLSTGAPDYGLMLSGDGSGSNTWKRLGASDSGEQSQFGPRLVVTWSGMRPTAQPGTVIASPLTWSSPLLAGQQMRFEVQVSHDGFATVDIDSETVKGKAGKANGWSLPDDAAASGGTYEWRVRVKYGADSAWSPWSNAAPVTITPAPENEGGIPIPHGATSAD